MKRIIFVVAALTLVGALSFGQSSTLRSGARESGELRVRFEIPDAGGAAWLDTLNTIFVTAEIHAATGDLVVPLTATSIAYRTASTGHEPGATTFTSIAGSPSTISLTEPEASDAGVAANHVGDNRVSFAPFGSGDKSDDWDEIEWVEVIYSVPDDSAFQADVTLEVDVTGSAPLGWESWFALNPNAPGTFEPFELALASGVDGAPETPLAAGESHTFDFSFPGFDPAATLEFACGTTSVETCPAWLGDDPTSIAGVTLDASGPSLTVTANNVPDGTNETLSLLVRMVDAVSDAGSPDPLYSSDIGDWVPVQVRIRDPELEIEPPSGPTNLRIGEAGDAVFTVRNAGGGELDITDVALPPFDYLANPGYAGASFSGFPTANGMVSNWAPTTRLQGLRYGTEAELTVRFVRVRPPAAGAGDELDVTFAYVEDDGSAAATSPQSAAFGYVEEPDAAERHDLVTVLDVSGSMSGSTSCQGDAATGSKIGALRSAGMLLYELMSFLYDANDFTGVVSYNQDPTPTWPSSWTGTRAAAAGSIAALAEVGGPIDALSAGGMTSISEALARAVGWLSGNTVADRKSVLLMTDGIHNRPGSDLAADFEFAMNEHGLPAAAVEGIEAHVVALGAAGSLNAAQLRAFAKSSPAGESGAPGDESSLLYQFQSGSYRHTCSTTNLAIYFAQVLADFDAEPEIILDDTGNLAVGTEGTYDIPVGTAARSAFFYVTWNDPRVQLSFELEGPGGWGGFTSEDREGYAFFRGVDLVGLGEKYRRLPYGVWRVTVTARPADGLSDEDMASVPQAIAFEYAALTQNPALRSNFDVFPGSATTGSTIVLRALLSEGLQPVAGADVRVRASVPLVGLGDYIHDGNAGLALPSIADPAGFAPAAQLAAILNGPDGPLPISHKEIVLRDNGVSPDERANDGVYTAAVLPAAVRGGAEHNGVYTYQFVASGTDLAGTPFRRTRAVSEYITSVPAGTVANEGGYYWGGSSTSGKVLVAAVDRFGNRIDPIPERSFVPKALNPSVLDFTVAGTTYQPDGSILVDLKATNGEFSPFIDAQELIDVGVVEPPAVTLPGPYFPTKRDAIRVGPPPGYDDDRGTAAPPTLAIETFRWSWGFELGLGYGAPLPASGAGSVGLVAIRGWYAGWPWLAPEIEVDLGVPPGDPSRTASQQVSVNARSPLPFTLGPLRPFVLVLGGVGRDTSAGSPTTYVPLGVGTGFRYYPDWRMKGGLTLELRDELLLRPGDSPMNTFRIIVAAHAHF